MQTPTSWRKAGWEVHVTAKASEQSARERLAIYLTKAVPILIAAKLTFLAVLAWNTRFVMDEFVQLGQAKYLGHGFFETIWPVKAVGYTVFYKLAHIVGWDAGSILLIGRMQTALLGCALLALFYGCARALAATKPQALMAVLVLLSFSNFIERIFRTRAEPLAVLFATAALFVLLRGSSLHSRRIVAAGILSGLAFITTQKSIYFNVALGLALLADAAFLRSVRQGLERGVWLVLGWAIPVIVYCFGFGRSHPIPVIENLFFGPVELVTVVPKVYADLHVYVWQTLARNVVLYVLCFVAMAIECARLRTLDSNRRMALVFSVLITLFVFTHNQPWPYVFVMALPFIALWVPTLLDRIADDPRRGHLVVIALWLAIGLSFVKNVTYLSHSNSDQLAVVARAEALLDPKEVYFDGNGMLPNRNEPSTLWLDRPLVVRTLEEGERSEAYRIFTKTPPKLVIWSYRLDAIEPVVGQTIRDSYVRVAPNIWLAGQRLPLGQLVTFDVPVAGNYRLYDRNGRPVSGMLDVGETTWHSQADLGRGRQRIALRSGPIEAVLVPEGHYIGAFAPGGDDPKLFDGVYD